MSEREFPVSDDALVWQKARPKRPFTPLEALMQAQPGSEPEASQMELLALRDVLADAIDALAPRERWVFNANVIEGQGVRRIAQDLGIAKSTVHLILQTAKRKLRERLLEHEVIRDRIHMG